MVMTRGLVRLVGCVDEVLLLGDYSVVMVIALVVRVDDMTLKAEVLEVKMLMWWRWAYTAEGKL
jgi:hypothetical protein